MTAAKAASIRGVRMEGKGSSNNVKAVQPSSQEAEKTVEVKVCSKKYQKESV
jgi:hypothetical protein